ncbi:MAG: UDP-N-acetylmuramoyl-L-alanyl-D-glutamate--2,6-diaminopimelate ligase [Gammaproteobacteria bacterium]
MMAMQKVDNRPNLKNLMQGMISQEMITDMPISGLCLDSRKVKVGDIFIALNSDPKNGMNFIKDAINKGAIAVLTGSEQEGVTNSLSIPIFSIPNIDSKLGLLASRYYNNPSQNLNIIGVTGTNGKTSVTNFLAQLLSDHGKIPVGSIGTLGSGIFGNLKSSPNTTPDILTINQLLANFDSHQIKDVVMEVSSHGLEQGRVDNVIFDSAVFTNLSRDHLDFHGDMSLYGAAKRKLFDTPGLKNAVINIDDEFGVDLATNISNQINTIRYGILESHEIRKPDNCDVTAKIIRSELNSITIDISSPWGKGKVSVALSGDFNVYNVLACLSVVCLQGITFDFALEAISKIQGVPGRMEYFGKPSTANIFIDYSHTPDALLHALETLRSQCKGRLVCVFGCGGDRDIGKRHQMGIIAEQYSDLVILTNDNPRNESPEKIIQDIQSGMKGRVPVEIIVDRSSAIQEAIQASGKDDYVLIAGKGHEMYQEIGLVKHPYSDRQQIRNLLEKLS